MQSAAYGIVWSSLIVLSLAGVLRVWPALSRAVLGTDPPTRNGALDGLRGLLALGVILHHGIIAHSHFGGAPWAAPVQNFDNLAGQGAVALFFMTSAYLFWGRIVRDGALDWPAFYRGRIRRLVPMYVAALALLLVIVAVETQFELRVSPSDLLLQIVRWASFSLMDLPDINGRNEIYTIFGVIWTLRFEWLFYFMLPFFAYVYGAVRWTWVFYGIALIVVGNFGPLRIVHYFITGAIAVHAVAAWSNSIRVRWIVSGIAVVALAGLVLGVHDVFDAVPALLLFPVFVAAQFAMGPFAILRWGPLRYLGHISYSVYLLHNPLIHIAGKFIWGPAEFASLSTGPLYLSLMGIACGTVVISTVTYLLIEKPFLSGGSWLRSSAPASAQFGQPT